MSCAPKTELNVRGVIFLVPTDVLNSEDWLVARLLSSALPSDRTSTGSLYLNVDPLSFRLILSLLSRDVVLDDETLHDLYTGPKMEWSILRQTLGYLCLPVWKGVLDKYAGAKKEIEICVAEVQAKLDIATKEILEQKAFWAGLGLLDMSHVVCGAHRLRQTGNSCQNSAIVIALTPGEGFKIPDCEVCQGPSKRRSNIDSHAELEHLLLDAARRASPPKGHNWMV